MQLLLRLATYPAAACSLVAVLFLASWAWPAGPGPDFLALPGLLSELGEARRLGDKLDRRQGRGGPRYEEREAVTVSLVEGRLGLAEAASRFLALSDSDPEAAGFVRPAYPGASPRRRPSARRWPGRGPAWWPARRGCGTR